ncbi:MAG: hypothetical protein ABI600_17380 [Luteolibacter sp.]
MILTRNPRRDRERGRRLLPMISPLEWSQKHLATVGLNVDRQWKIVETGDQVDSRELIGSTEV